MTVRTTKIKDLEHLPLVFEDTLVKVFLKEYKVDNITKRKLILFFKHNGLVLENKGHVSVERVEEILKKQTWREVNRSIKGLYQFGDTKKTVSQIYNFLKSEEDKKKVIERLQPLFSKVVTIRTDKKEDIISDIVDIFQNIDSYLTKISNSLLDFKNSFDKEIENFKADLAKYEKKFFLLTTEINKKKAIDNCEDALEL
ncbi:MAG: hypothetical protein ACTSP3_14205 [Candidatus Heimdallarchaeaceae archaeon]